MQTATPGETGLRPLLTIAVPTYNRSANLSLLLGMLAPQLSGLPEVELLISDNASPDDTEAVVRGHMAAGLRCRYLRNPENLDADPNFLQCYEQARGKYVWLFGDDDALFPGSVAKVVRLLGGRELDLVFLAPFGFLEDPNERGLANPEPAIYEFTKADEFVHAVGLRGDLVMIAAVIVNKDTVEKELHPDFAGGFRTQLLQLGWVFTALKHFRRGLVIECGLYSVCEDNPKRMFDLAKVFGVNWSKAADTYLVAGTETHRAILRSTLYSWFVTNWYGMRRRPEHTILNDAAGQMWPIYGEMPLFWMCTYPIVACPMLLAGCWVALWRLIRRFDRMVQRVVHPPIRLV